MIMENKYPFNVEQSLSYLEIACIEEIENNKEGTYTHLCTLLDHLMDTCTGRVELRQAILDNIITPLKKLKLSKNIKKMIAESGYVAIGSIDTQCVEFVYSIGLLEKYRFELLCGMSGIPILTINEIVSTTVDHLKEHGNLNTLPSNVGKLTSGENLRIRIDEMPIADVLHTHLLMVPNFQDVLPDDKVLIIRLPDANNILPGEEGYDTDFKQPLI